MEPSYDMHDEAPLAHKTMLTYPSSIVLFIIRIIVTPLPVHSAITISFFIHSIALTRPT